MNLLSLAGTHIQKANHDLNLNCKYHITKKWEKQYANSPKMEIKNPEQVFKTLPCSGSI